MDKKWLFSKLLDVTDVPSEGVALKTEQRWNSKILIKAFTQALGEFRSQ